MGRWKGRQETMRRWKGRQETMRRWKDRQETKKVEKGEVVVDWRELQTTTIS